MIAEALKKLSSKVVKKDVSWDDNKLKIQSTFTPPRADFNETWQNILETNNKFKGIK